MARHTFATTETLVIRIPIKKVLKLLEHPTFKATQISTRIADKKISEDVKSLQKRPEVSRESRNT